MLVVFDGVFVMFFWSVLHYIVIHFGVEGLEAGEHIIEIVLATVDTTDDEVLDPF